MTWWEDYPERLEQECEALRECGCAFAIDNDARSAGRLEIALTVSVRDTELSLRALYPEYYPYFPPGVIAKHGTFHRHQNPVSGQLCLLEEGGNRTWSPTKDTLATLLEKQLPKLFDANASDDADSVSAIEQHSPEPVTAFHDKEPQSHVTVPFGDIPQCEKSGYLLLQVETFKPFRASVLEIQDRNGHPLVYASAGVKKRCERRNCTTIKGRWTQLDNAPPDNAPETIRQFGTQVEPSFSTTSWLPFDSKNNKLDVRAVCFPDELSWREVKGINWIITVDRRDASKGKFDKSRVSVRSELDGHEVAQVRVPELAPLRKKSISIFGAGSVGSVVAELLCQGLIGRINIVDGDVFEAGNAVRWATGRSVAGISKAEALSTYLNDNYPFTECNGTYWPLGVTLSPYRREKSDRTVLDHALENVDLVIDATAAVLLSNLLSDLAQRRGLPYIWGHTTHGAWGGLAGRIDPNKSMGCWNCHLHWLNNDDAPTILAADTMPDAHPLGCADPTFPGASMDINEVSLMLARLATATLCRATPNDSSDYPWDIAILSQRDPHGALAIPTWTTYLLDPHQRCCAYG